MKKICLVLLAIFACSTSFASVVLADSSSKDSSAPMKNNQTGEDNWSKGNKTTDTDKTPPVKN